jgi:putative tricarboxylic transport membrane protein
MPVPARISLRQTSPDRLAAIAILALCAGVYAATWHFDTVSAVISQGMGPEAFPRLVIGVIAVLAVLLALRPRHRGGVDAEPIAPMVLYTTAALLGFMIAVPVLGMLPSMALLIVGLGRLWGERHLLRLAGAAAFLSVAIWAVFVRGLGVPLPGGLLRQLVS